MADGAFVGRDVVVNYAIAVETVDPATLTFKRLGMMRGKESSFDWSTADSTGDMSAAFTKEALVTYKEFKFSGDGVVRGDALYNQVEFKSQAISPGAATGYQPKFWLQIIDYVNGVASGMYQGPVIVNGWKDSRPNDDVATFSFEAMGNGDVAFTPA